MEHIEPKDDRWVVEYNEEGKPIFWQPYEQYIAGKFYSAVFDRTFIGPMIWGRPKITDEKEIYKIAQEIFEKEFKDILPIEYLEQYNK